MSSEAPSPDTAPPAAKVHALYDASEVKRVLDDCASQTVIDAGYAEDFWISNVKIGLGLLTCATALLAQFYPVPFPRNYWLLVACVLSYFTLNTLLQAFCYYVERDTILLTKGKEGAPRTGRGLKLSSSLPRYSDQYTLSLQVRGASADSKPHELSKSVAAWIYEDGELDQSGFGAEVLRLLSQCETGRTKRD